MQGIVWLAVAWLASSGLTYWHLHRVAMKNVVQHVTEAPTAVLVAASLMFGAILTAFAFALYLFASAVVFGLGLAITPQPWQCCPLTPHHFVCFVCHPMMHGGK